MGKIIPAGKNSFDFSYSSKYDHCVYDFCLNKFQELINNYDNQQRFYSMLWKLRNINFRNHLTNAIIRFIIDHQVPISAFLTDKSRLSRLIPQLKIYLPWHDHIVSLSHLLPSMKKLNSYRLRKLIDNEYHQISSKVIKKALSDQQLAMLLNQIYNLQLTRRYITGLRTNLGIQRANKRCINNGYNCQTSAFAKPWLFSRDNIKHINELSGVYEFSLPETETTNRHIVYIGSSNNLKKRFRAHLALKNNKCLGEHIKKGVYCRHLFIKDEWRTKEKELYNTHAKNFGDFPRCNIISP